MAVFSDHKTKEYSTEDRSLLGKMLGEYEIRKEIGRGGMGIVFEAYQKSLGRFVAVKILPLTQLTDATTVERFIREAKATAKLDHPNIVKIFDTGQEPDLNYFVMELVRGKTLANIIDTEGRLPQFHALNIFKQIASALSFAHKESIIHRDIKPANILIDNFGRVTVTDFGIAKTVTGEKLTVTGTLMGTPEYMSPEQVRGEEVDSKTDIFSFGVLMYETLTAKLPFTADSALGVLRKVIELEPAQPRSLNTDLHADLEYIVLKAMEKNAQRRYQNAQQIIEDILKFERGIPLHKDSQKNIEEELKLTKSIGELFKQLFASLKIINLYNADHPLVADAVNAAYKTLLDFFKVRKSLTISLMGDKLLAEEIPFSDKDTTVKRLLAFMHTLKIDSITFHEGITNDEFQTFLKVTSANTQSGIARGALAKKLLEKGIAHIKVDEVVYTKVSKSEQKADDENEKIKDILLTNYLMGKVDSIRGRETQLLSDLKNRPERIAQLVLQSVKTVDASQYPQGLDPKANIVIETLGKLGNDILKGSLGGWAGYKKNLAEILVALEPQMLRENVFLSDAPQASHIITQAADGLSDLKIIELITGVYGRTKSTDNIKLLFQRLLPDTEKTQRVMPALKAALLGLGMTEKEFEYVSMQTSNIQDLPLDQKASELAARNPKNMLEAGIIEFVKPVIIELIQLNKSGRAAEIVTKFLSNLRDPDQQVRLRAAGDFTVITAGIIEKNGFELIELSSNLLTETAKNEADIAVFSLCNDILLQCAGYFINAKKIHGAARITRMWQFIANKGNDFSVNAKKSLERLAKPEFIKILVEALKFDAIESAEVLSSFGESAIDPLIDMLTQDDGSQNDPFEFYVVGRKIANILKKIGGDSIRKIAAKFSDPNWKVARNAIRIFEDIITDRASASMMAPAVMHSDPKARKSAILALEHIRGQEASKLLKLASMDQDPEVSECALLALNSMKGTQSSAKNSTRTKFKRKPKN
ncbi:MAG: protein kinase [Planctomycetes bacterium]|nr:protein kinase [Planctomycetota bacterium]